MSYPGQIHHPHVLGTPPNAHLISQPDGPDKPYVPQGLELLQATWIVRHGERTPVKERLSGVGEIPAIFPLCSFGKQFQTCVMSLTSPAILDGHDSTTFQGQDQGSQGSPPLEAIPLSKPKGPEPENVTLKSQNYMEVPMEVYRTSESPGSANNHIARGPNDCIWGQLTDLGKQSTLTLGGILHSIYVNQLGFLPEKLTEKNQFSIYLRSTDMPRTVESLLHITQGIFPDREVPVRYTVRTPFEESLYPNSMCRNLVRMNALAEVKVLEDFNPTLEALDSTWSKYNDGKPIRIDGKPRASGLLDTIVASNAHGIKVPSELCDLEKVVTLEKAVVQEWFASYKFHGDRFKRLAMGRMLGDLKNSMDGSIRGTDPVKLAVMTCHDTSIGGILNSLDVFDWRWPPFTSHISFELFKTQPPQSFISRLLHPTSHYVRVRYNGKPVKIPSCAPAGKHLKDSNGSVCTYEAFNEAIKKVEVTTAEWKELCATKN